jgi:hypothetical protein
MKNYCREMIADFLLVVVLLESIVNNIPISKVPSLVANLMLGVAK